MRASGGRFARNSILSFLTPAAAWHSVARPQEPPCALPSPCCSSARPSLLHRRPNRPRKPSRRARGPTAYRSRPGVVDAEVGQTIRFTATAYDASGGVIEAKPTAWFGAPFDVGAADEEGLVTVYAPGELKVGAIVNGKPGWATDPHQAAAGDLGDHRAACRAAGARRHRAARGRARSPRTASRARAWRWRGRRSRRRWRRWTRLAW